MKPLDSEVAIEKVLSVVKQIRPDWKLPNIEDIGYFDSIRTMGYITHGIKRICLSVGSNGDIADTNEIFVETILHELTHGNVTMNHSSKFWAALVDLKQDYTKATGLEFST